MTEPFNIIINLPGDDLPEAHYDAHRGESLDAFIRRVTRRHPDWTSAVMVIGPSLIQQQTGA